MRTFNTILALFIISTVLSCTAPKTVSSAVNQDQLEQKIVSLSKDKWRWMAEKTTDSLAALFHNKSMFVHMGGSWGKERELDVIKSGRIWYKEADIYATSLHVMGSTAILLSDIDLVAVVGGNEVINPFMVTEVYLNEDGTWQLGSLTFSRLARPIKKVKKLGLKKVWESDTLTLNGPESVLYDSETNALYVSSMNSGAVVRMDTSGKVLQKDWVTGLTSNKGSAFHEGLFYTAETSGLAVIDASTGKVNKRIPVKDAVMLNDVEVDAKGIVYVTDTRTGKVYRIANGQPEVYLENLPGANGLLTVNDDLYVVSSTGFYKVDASKKLTTIADGFESGLDGIVMLTEDEFILSNYRGILYHVKANGEKRLLLDTRAESVMANDIGYNSKTRTLYVPSFSTNRVIAY